MPNIFLFISFLFSFPEGWDDTDKMEMDDIDFELTADTLSTP